jgi:hypothetical protein
MAEARKYIISCVTQQPSGLTNVTLATVTYDLLNAFSGTRDTPEGGSFSYNNTTLQDVGLMTDIQYNQRVSDFLIYVEIQTTSRRATLLSEAQYTEVLC